MIDREGWGSHNLKKPVIIRPGDPLEPEKPEINYLYQNLPVGPSSTPGRFLTDIPLFHQFLGCGCYQEDTVTGEVFPWPDPCTPIPINIQARRREVLAIRGPMKKVPTGPSSYGGGCCCGDIGEFE